MSLTRRLYVRLSEDTADLVASLRSAEIRIEYSAWALLADEGAVPTERPVLPWSAS